MSPAASLAASRLPTHQIRRIRSAASDPPHSTATPVAGYSSLDSTDSGYTQQPWLPDEICAHCMICQRPFHIWRWTHHCRDCGGIFCKVSPHPMPPHAAHASTLAPHTLLLTPSSSHPPRTLLAPSSHPPPPPPRTLLAPSSHLPHPPPHPPCTRIALLIGSFSRTRLVPRRFPAPAPAAADRAGVLVTRPSEYATDVLSRRRIRCTWRVRTHAPALAATLRR